MIPQSLVFISNASCADCINTENSTASPMSSDPPARDALLNNLVVQRTLVARGKVATRELAVSTNANVQGNLDVGGNGQVTGDLDVQGQFSADNTMVLGWADIHFAAQTVTTPSSTLVNMYDGTTPLFTQSESCGICLRINDGSVTVLKGGVYLMTVNLDFGSTVGLTSYTIFYGINVPPDTSDVHNRIGSAAPVGAVVPLNVAGTHIVTLFVGDVISFYALKNTVNADNLVLSGGTVTLTRQGLFLSST